MAIKLEVKPYCSDCGDFEADVVKPEKDFRFLHDTGNQKPVTVYCGKPDTIVRCKYAKRCESLVRYLHLSKADEKYEQMEIGVVLE